MVLKGFPNVVIRVQQYNIGEKSTFILYININHHVGTKTKQTQTRYTVFLGQEFRTTVQ